MEVNEIINSVVPDEKPAILPIAFAVIAGVLLWNWFQDNDRGSIEE